MKRKICWIVILLVIGGNIICLWPENVVDKNIRLAGYNGKELKAVLAHYKKTGDKQKERCARYLIARLVDKMSVVYDAAGRKEELGDLYVIKADFLIDNIDLAVETWKKYPWCRHLTEDEFCEQLLPYRIKNEPLENWRSYYYTKYKAVADSMADIHATMEEVVFFFNSRYGKKYTHETEKYPGDLSFHLIEKIGGGTCDHLALNAVQVLRSIGIPLNLDVLPFHGKVNGGHAYNSFTDEKGVFHYFSPYEREPERKQWVAPVVRRIIFDAPRYRNVTEYYYPVTDVTLEQPGLSIATHNRGVLKVITPGKTEGGKSCFKTLSCGLLYFPVDAQGNPADIPPFILDESGPRFVPSPDKTHKVSLKGLHMYDVRRILPLEDGQYVLLGWEKGWHELATACPSDSVTISFDSVPDYKLFLLYKDTFMGRMQRPFVIEGDSILFY